MFRRYASLLAVTVLLLGAMGVLLFLGQAEKAEGPSLPPLKISLLKVGKADCIVIRSEAQTTVIDAGEEDDGQELVNFLEAEGIRRVDNLIITHYDQDHVGGADTLVEEMEVSRVLLPDYESTHTEYLDFQLALADKGIVPERLRQKVEFQMGQANVVVEPPVNYDTVGGSVEMDNNFSLITTVTHGSNKLLFTGDAEKQRIRQWLAEGTAQDVDFLKVPHHGVYTSALKDLLEAVKPEYSVICSSQKNPGDIKTVELLKQYGASVFETKDGNVTVISDGRALELHQQLH